MNRSTMLAIGCIVFSFVFCSTAFSDRSIRRNTDGRQRTALVIGNGDYQSAPLKNPANDAADMAAALKKMGFEVIHLQDAGQRKMEDAVSDFGNRLRDGGVGLFYYAGHGVQVRGQNYLIPVDAQIKTEADVRYRAVNADWVLDKMGDAQNGVNIVILDACRDNPFSRSFRTSKTGLAQMQVTTGALIAYATAPGAVAADGKGRNGLFTGCLLRHMKNPDLKVEDVLKNVRADVVNATQREQVPWVSSSLIGDFYFASSGYSHDDPAKQKATITIETRNVTGAWVRLGSETIGETPLKDYAVTPGSYRLSVGKDGFVTYRRNIRIDPNRAVSFVVELTSQTPKTARLYVDTQPENAVVKIMNIREKFYNGISLNSGRYELLVSADGCTDETQYVDLAAGRDANLFVTLKCQGSGRKNRISGPYGMEFAYVAPGTFMMGSPSGEDGRDSDEKQHQVTLTRGFYMQTTEVTQGQWKAVMGNNPSYFKNCGDNCPVEKVSWNDAQEFIQKLNQREGRELYRLPTEAEWEYAARSGGKNEKYSGSNNIDQVAWYRSNSNSQTHKVGTKSPNGLGIYDMSGNVWEWCQDWYGEYPSGSVTNPTGPSSGSARVLRGGGWISSAAGCRSAYRDRYDPGNRSYSLGFRLLRIEP